MFFTMPRAGYPCGADGRIRERIPWAGCFKDTTAWYWCERLCKWEHFPGGRSHDAKIERGAGVILLRRSDVVRLRGFGDALEALESDRRLRSNAPTQPVQTEAYTVVIENGQEIIDLTA